MGYWSTYEYKKLRADKVRERAVAYLGGRCAGCGMTSGPFHFHHQDPEMKEFVISTALPHLSWERLLPEIDKCELRCVPCHIEHHRSTAECGTAQRYWAGCRCKPCTSANADHSRAYKASLAPARKSYTPRDEIAHGTYGGYKKECRLGIPRCEECKAANRRYMAERSQK